MKLDVLAIGAHPDDVELGCGGTLARLAAEGRAVGILHLTRGERGTRGTPEGRQAEAEAAAAALGAKALDFLDCGDGGLRTGPAEEDSLIVKLRLWRPDLVLAPSPHDRHPDHTRAPQPGGGRLLLRRSQEPRRGRGLPAGRPVRLHAARPLPAELHRRRDGELGRRRSLSLRAYRSQIHQPDEKDKDGAPMTKVASPEFRLAVDGRARHFGLLIGARLRRALLSRGPLAAGGSPLSPAGRCAVRIGISCYPTYGGSGIVATELAMALAEGGDEVHVISYALPSRLTFLNSRIFFHEVVTPTYPLFENFPPYSLALTTKMVEVARHAPLDVLHVHYAIPTPSPRCWRGRSCSSRVAGGDDAPRHRRHPGGQ